MIAPNSLRLRLGDYSAFHKTFDRRFAKFVVNFIMFASNLGISIRNCQSNGKL